MKYYYHCVSARQSRTRFLFDTVFVGYDETAIANAILVDGKYRHITKSDCGGKDAIIVPWDSTVELGDIDKILDFKMLA